MGGACQANGADRLGRFAVVRTASARRCGNYELCGRVPFSEHGEMLPHNALSRLIWESRYRHGPPGARAERSVADTWDRVARALAVCEPAERVAYEAEFRRALDGFKFLPAGRILAGAGTGRAVTLANCFVSIIRSRKPSTCRQICRAWRSWTFIAALMRSARRAVPCFGRTP